MQERSLTNLLAANGTTATSPVNVSMKLTILQRSASNPTSAASVSQSSAIPGPTTRRQLAIRRRRSLTASSPPDRGVQIRPLSVSPHPVVVQEPLLPLTGQDLSEINDFILIKPVPPEIKVSSLKSSMFYLPDAKIFMDKSLPDPEPSFLARITPNVMFSPDYFTGLHNLVNAPGHGYPEGTYNYLGARICLEHTSFNIPTWKNLLADYPRKELVDFLQYGFPIGVSQEGITEPSLKNHSSSYMYFSHLDKFCIKEIAKTGLTGPFGNVPFSSYQISPMMTSFKKPSSRRPVFDASFGVSLNKITPHDFYLDYRAEYDFPKLDHLEQMILDVGKGALLWKRDLSRYFLQLPLDPVDYKRTGFIWRQNYFFFISYMFGLRHSGWAGQSITSAVTWIHRRQGFHFDGAPFRSLNYSDDLAGVEPIERAQVSFQAMGDLLVSLGLDEAAAKASGPETKMEYLGVEFNSITFTKTVPPAKMAQMKDTLFTWLNKKTCTKRQLQSLCGQLLWVARCVQHSRCFISRLLAGLKTLGEQHHKMTLTPEMLLDILWWYTYIKEYNGVSFMINPLNATIKYAGDACKKGGGAYFGSEYWSRLLPDHMCGDNPPIHLKEFYVLLISMGIWGPLWSGQAVELYCDNTAVVDVCNYQKPRDAEMARFLREFLLLVVSFKFYPVVKKISTTDNWVADFLSREFNQAAHNSFFEHHNMSAMTRINVPDNKFSFSATW